MMKMKMCGSEPNKLLSGILNLSVGLAPINIEMKVNYTEVVAESKLNGLILF